MAKKIKNYSDLRFMAKDNLKHQQKIMGENYRDIIHNYGIDVTYFRRLIESELDTYTGNLSSDIRHIYNDGSTDSYWLSADMIIYLDIQGDSYLLSKFGIQTEADGAAYFTVDDFTEKFVDDIGEQVTGILSGTFDTPFVSCYYDNKVMTSGWLSGIIGNADISGIVKEDCYSHLHDFYATNSHFLSGLNVIPEVVNSDIFKPSYYDYERTISGDNGWYCTYSGHVDDNWIGHATGVMSGTYIYNTRFHEKNHKKLPIRPQVGDFFRMNDFQEDNPEEYEITEMTDRNLMSDGISPLLGTYIWKMNVVRREPSYEEILDGKGDQEEPDTLSQLDNNKWDDLVGDEIFDYDKQEIDGQKDVDNVYGDFGLPNILKKKTSKNTDETSDIYGGI